MKLTEKSRRAKLKLKKQSEIQQGYRLHIERLKLNSTGEKKYKFTRSFKFPIDIDLNAHEQIFLDIANDYKALVGNFNFSDWLSDKRNNFNSRPCLLRFWQEALRRNILIAEDKYKAKKLMDLVAGISDTQLNDAFLLFQQDLLKEDYSEVLKLSKQKFQDFVLIDPKKPHSLDYLSKYLLDDLFFKEIKNKTTREESQKQQADLLKKFLVKKFNIRIDELGIQDIRQLRSALASEYFKKDLSILKGNNENENTFLKISKEDLKRLLPDFNWEDDGQDFNKLLYAYHSLAKIFYPSEKKKDENDKVLEAITGLANNQSGLSNFFIEAFKSKDINNENNLADLSTQGMDFKLASAADYRTQIGGILSSYTTSLIKRRDELKEAKSKFSATLQNIKEIIGEINSVSLADLFTVLEKSAANYIQDVQEASYELFLLDLAELKTRLNELILEEKPSSEKQPGRSKKKNKPKKEKSKKDLLNEEFSKLNLDRPIRFPGCAKEEQFKKFYYAYEMFMRFVDFYRSAILPVNQSLIIKEDLDDSAVEEKFRIVLQTLAYLYDNASTRFRHLLIKYYRDTLDLETVLRSNEINLTTEEFLKNYRSSFKKFYVSKFSKANYQQLVFPEDFDFRSNLEQLFNNLSIKWDSVLDGSEKDIESRTEDLVSAIEIEKIRSGIYFFYYRLSQENQSVIDKYNGDFSNLDRDEYLDLKTFDALIRYSSSELSFQRRFLNVLFTTLRAKLSMVSRKEELVRYVLNPIKSEEKFKLFAISHEEKGLAFSLALDKESRDSAQILENTKYFVYKKASKEKDESKGESSFKEHKSRTKLPSMFSLKSSKYQIQFLYRAFEKSFNEKGLDNYNGVSLEIASWSLIAEQKFNIKWEKLTENNAYSYPALTASEDFDSRRVYVSMPFTFTSSAGKESILRNNFIGFDVGEYGIAYVVIEKKDTSEAPSLEDFTIKDGGFIHSHLVRKIKDHYRENQKIQRSATFSRPNSKLALIRENAIGSLRNRLHHLVVKYQAKPIYEWQISNFETKSNRVTKIYNSVKRSDPYHKSAVEDALRKHVWGDKSSIGAEVSAYATSYTCSCCARSPYSIVEKSYKLTHLQADRYLMESIDSGSGDEDKFEANLFLKSFDRDDLNAKKLNGKDLLKALKDWARPPIEVVNEILDLTPDQSEELVLLRGNSFIYRCPFCNSITDADIQAALNIAILGSLKKETKKGDQDESAKYYPQLISLLKRSENSEAPKVVLGDFLRKGLDFNSYVSA
ncbi:MAG: type V CRISPR-associated protein Cas12d [Cyanobacteria bacterium REEB446]|nr:type V CRISPR-associated protein Cas12d [Cyanobacteria bacterium REEB446]